MPLRFLVVLIVFALPIPAEAQRPPKLPKIGWLFGGTAANMASQRDEIVRLLHELDYIESKKIALSIDSGKRPPPFKQ